MPPEGAPVSGCGCVAVARGVASGGHAPGPARTQQIARAAPVRRGADLGMPRYAGKGYATSIFEVVL
jgi:hypothetical protein